MVVYSSLVCGWGDRDLVSPYNFYCAFVFSIRFSFPLFRWLEKDGCCICFFVFSLFSLPLFSATTSF